MGGTSQRPNFEILATKPGANRVVCQRVNPDYQDHVERLRQALSALPSDDERRPHLAERLDEAEACLRADDRDPLGTWLITSRDAGPESVLRIAELRIEIVRAVQESGLLPEETSADRCIQGWLHQVVACGLATKEYVRATEEYVRDNRPWRYAEKDGSALIRNPFEVSAILWRRIEHGVDLGSALAMERFHTGTETASNTDDRDAGVAQTRARVDAWIRMTKAKGDRKASRTTFWKQAGYANPTEFQRWQRHDSRSSHRAAQAFERLLKVRGL